MLKVKQIRTDRSLSVPELVSLSGLSRRTIQEIEKRGDCLVSNAAKLAGALGVTVGDLWEDEKEEEA